MSRTRSIFEKLKGMKLLQPMLPILTTLEGIFTGTEVVTLEAPHIREHLEIKRYMTAAIIGLMPTLVAAVIFFVE